MLHVGHVAFLETVKKFLSGDRRLIIGLTTDSLAEIQKRPVTIPYEQRKRMLEALRLFNPEHDVVIPHDGATKTQYHSMFPFDVVMIGDDYWESKEYKDICCVPVFYIPRHPTTSTSKILSRVPPTGISRHITSEPRNVRVPSEKTIGVRDLEVAAYGTTGALLVGKAVHDSQYTRAGDRVFIKHIPIGSREYGRTDNVYNLPFPYPRRWKRLGAEHTAPILSGANTNREVEVHKFLAGRPYNPVLFATYTGTPNQCATNTRDDEASPLDCLERERKRPYTSVLLWQRNAGVPLSSIWPQATEQKKIMLLRQAVSILADLFQRSVVHGDMHLDNLVVDAGGNVSLIDFGWCMHHSFDASPQEREQYHTDLVNFHDFQALSDAIQWQTGVEMPEKQKLLRTLVSLTSGYNVPNLVSTSPASRPAPRTALSS